jgi:hypothetical protein
MSPFSKPAIWSAFSSFHPHARMGKDFGDHAADRAKRELGDVGGNVGHLLDQLEPVFGIGSGQPGLGFALQNRYPDRAGRGDGLEVVDVLDLVARTGFVARLQTGEELVVDHARGDELEVLRLGGSGRGNGGGDEQDTQGAPPQIFS